MVLCFGDQTRKWVPLPVGSAPTGSLRTDLSVIQELSGSARKDLTLRGEPVVQIAPIGAAIFLPPLSSQYRDCLMKIDLEFRGFSFSHCGSFHRLGGCFLGTHHELEKLRRKSVTTCEKRRLGLKFGWRIAQFHL